MLKGNYGVRSNNGLLNTGHSPFALFKLINLNIPYRTYIVLEPPKNQITVQL